MIGQYFFLGATLRDVTSQSVRHHNKHSFIKRIHDVKKSPCTIYEDYYKFGFNFVTRYVGLIISLTFFFIYFELYSNLAIAKFIPRYIRILFRLIC